MRTHPLEQYDEFICPYDREQAKIKNENKIIGVTTDYCESCGMGRGCLDRDNCLDYICAKKKQFEVIISEKQESI